MLRHLLERAEAHVREQHPHTAPEPPQGPPAGTGAPHRLYPPLEVRHQGHQTASHSWQVAARHHATRPAFSPCLRAWQVVREAVITVPAHFGPAARAATVEAGLMAGLQRVELLQGGLPALSLRAPARVVLLLAHPTPQRPPLLCGAEPVAAAMAYGFGSGGSSAQAYATLLVFDLGGGTLDVSVLEGWDGILEVRAHSGGRWRLRTYSPGSKHQRGTTRPHASCVLGCTLRLVLAQALATDGDDQLGGDDLTRSIAELVLLQAGRG